MQILRIIRSGVNALFITGGEPFLHPDIDELIRRAKQELNFREITLITNGFLLSRHEAALPFIDRLIVSLDSLNAESWSPIIGIPQASSRIHSCQHPQLCRTTKRIRLSDDGQHSAFA